MQCNRGDALLVCCNGQHRCLAALYIPQVHHTTTKTYGDWMWEDVLGHDASNKSLPYNIPPTTVSPSNATALHSAVCAHGPIAVGVERVVDGVVWVAASASPGDVRALHDQHCTNPSSPPLSSTLLLLMVPVMHAYAGPVCACMRWRGGTAPVHAAGRARFSNRLCSVCTLCVGCACLANITCKEIHSRCNNTHHNSPQAVVATTWRSLTLLVGSQAASYSTVCVSNCSCSTVLLYSSNDALLSGVLEVVD